MTQNQIAYQNMLTERAKLAEQTRHNKAEDYRKDFLTPYEAAKLTMEVNELQSRRKQEIGQMWKNIVGAAVGLLTGGVGRVQEV